MKIEVLSDKKLIGEAAAEVGAKALREALAAIVCQIHRERFERRERLRLLLRLKAPDAR